MNYSDAIEAVKSGKKVKLPEWTGYWFRGDDGRIMVFTADCQVLDTPFTKDYTERTDWQITDGNRDFGGALKALRAGKRVQRIGWNGKGIFVELQIPDSDSKMSRPYLYIDTTNLESDNPAALRAQVPWLPSQTDMFADDWQVLPQKEF